MSSDEQKGNPTTDKKARRAEPQDTGSSSLDVTSRLLLPDPGRRNFLTTGVAAATAALFPGAVSLARSGPADNGPGPGAPAISEPRAYVFDYSMLDLRHHELFLVAGRQRLQLDRLSKKDRLWLREQYPVLEMVPDDRMTHWVLAYFPAEAVQFCHVRRIERRYLNQGQGAGRGRPWDWVGQFTHLPVQALLEAAELIRRSLAYGALPPVPSKWRRLGLTAEEIAYFDDPVGLDTLKTSDDTATCMVSQHPELVSGDPTSAAYVNQSIVAPQVDDLSQVIDFYSQTGANGCSPQNPWNGCGTPIVQNDLSWGTLVPVCDPDTEQQAVNSSGDLQYVPIYSSDTNQAAAGAITASLQQVKNDPSLGANTSSDPTQQAGTLYRYGDGVTTSDQTTDGLGAGNGLSYTTVDYSPGQGYSVSVTDVQASSTTGITANITVTVSNWYVRYLGLYVAYLDGDGNAVAPPAAVLSILDSAFPLRGPQGVGDRWDADNALFLDILGPEKEILGLPTGERVKTLTLPMPNTVTSLLVLASGIGTMPASANVYAGTCTPGAVMTGIFELALPTFFLALNAASGVAKLKAGMEETANVLSILPLCLNLFADTFQFIAFDDPSAFEKMGPTIGKQIISKGAKPLTEYVVTCLTEGETEQDLLDAIPFVGGFFAMIAALTTITQIAETSTQLLQSPSTYAFEVTLTHDIDVVIAGDPNNAGSWPSTATNFEVVLLFNKGTPTKLTVDLPGTTVQSQTASFLAVPLGGKVSASVQVSSDSGFQVATASLKSADNLDSETPLKLNLQLTQAAVPLTADTVYTHKEVIALNEAGEHVWLAAAGAPPTQAPLGCTPASGQLCELTGITVNTTAGAVGQSFRSANAAVGDCTSGGAGGQTDQLSNISVTATPQNGYFYSGCGFGAPPRLVYDLVNDPDFNFYLDTSAETLQQNPDFQGGVIRQIRLSAGNQGFDGPDSNLAWGKLRFPSNALLLHPGRKIVSINATHSKIEVIDLPRAALADALAPGSHTHGGRGLREGLMDSPVLATLAPDGTVLVLESNNRRIQAFDLNANPARKFGATSSNHYFDLKDQAVDTYLSFAAEFAGHMYVLWKDVAGNQTLDIYDPTGNFLCSTPDFVGRTMTVNYWRDIFTQNAQVLRLPNGDLPTRTEPSVSHWIPSTPTP